LRGPRAPYDSAVFDPIIIDEAQERAWQVLEHAACQAAMSAVRSFSAGGSRQCFIRSRHQRNSRTRVGGAGTGCGQSSCNLFWAGVTARGCSRWTRGVTCPPLKRIVLTAGRLTTRTPHLKREHAAGRCRTRLARTDRMRATIDRSLTSFICIHEPLLRSTNCPASDSRPAGRCCR